MVVWFAHVRVGHRQTLIAKCPLRLRGRGFFLAEKNGDGFQIRPRLVPGCPRFQGRGRISNPSPSEICPRLVIRQFQGHA